jgi:hypothetical protein
MGSRLSVSNRQARVLSRPNGAAANHCYIDHTAGSIVPPLQDRYYEI